MNPDKANLMLAPSLDQEWRKDQCKTWVKGASCCFWIYQGPQGEGLWAVLLWVEWLKPLSLYFHSFHRTSPKLEEVIPLPQAVSIPMTSIETCCCRLFRGTLCSTVSWPQFDETPDLRESLEGPQELKSRHCVWIWSECRTFERLNWLNSSKTQERRGEGEAAISARYSLINPKVDDEAFLVLWCLTTRKLVISQPWDRNIK